MITIYTWQKIKTLKQDNFCAAAKFYSRVDFSAIRRKTSLETSPPRPTSVDAQIIFSNILQLFFIVSV